MRDNSSYKKSIQAKPMALRSIRAGDVLAVSSSEFTLKQSAPNAYLGSKRVNAWFELAKGFR